MKRGKIPINKRIDFHGLSVDEAKKLFLKTINDCFINNSRCILFITGKGIEKNTNTNFLGQKLY